MLEFSVFFLCSYFLVRWKGLELFFLWIVLEIMPLVPHRSSCTPLMLIGERELRGKGEGRRTIWHEFCLLPLFVLGPSFFSFWYADAGDGEFSSLGEALYHAVSSARGTARGRREWNSKRGKGKGESGKAASVFLCRQLFRSSRPLFSCWLRRCSCSQSRGRGFDYLQSKREGINLTQYQYHCRQRVWN